MPSTKLQAKKSSSTASSTATASKALQEVKKKADSLSLKGWIDANDALLDNTVSESISIDALLTDCQTKRAFLTPKGEQMVYDWSAFRAALEGRDENSSRWFIHIREEDLLCDPDGLEGVTLNCCVVAEVTIPTLAPAEYVVKTHWPYSDAEDNAPERILEIQDLGMCWRRVVKNDGTFINAYVLQKKGEHKNTTYNNNNDNENNSSAEPATGALGSAISFGFGSMTQASSTPEISPTAQTIPFSFSSGGVSQPSVFGFGTQVSTTATSSSTEANAGFSFNLPAPTQLSFNSVPSSFGFGSPPLVPDQPASQEASALTNNTTNSNNKINTTNVLFTLWSLSRLREMEKEIRSGSRIVREGFQLDSTATHKIKLVMQNDMKDDIPTTVRRIILQKLFAKKDKGIAEVDEWISGCPTYDQKLTEALQKFRENYLEKEASTSPEFEQLLSKYANPMQQELERIVKERRAAAEKELESIKRIQTLIKEKKVAEKKDFRLLKFYPRNNIQRFRPFGKVSGISEMGEYADFCEPPAHVVVNPFMKKA